MFKSKVLTCLFTNSYRLVRKTRVKALDTVYGRVNQKYRQDILLGEINVNV